MRLRNTIILVAVALALVLFIAVFERSTPSTSEIQERERLAYPEFKGKGDVADALELIRGPNKIVLVKRDVGTADEHWQITRPIDFPADTSRIIAILNAFERAEKTSLSEGERSKPLSPTDNLEEYGLSHDTAVRVVAMAGSRTLLDAFVGGETAASGKVYAAPADRTCVFVVSEDVRTNTAVRVDELRDKRMLHLARGRITHIGLLKDEQPVVELTRGPENDWRLTSPVSDRADPGKVEDIIDRVGSLWAEAFKVDFAQDDKEMIQKLREFGLKPAVRSIKVTRTIADVPVHHEVLFGNRVKKTEGNKVSWSVYAMVGGSRSVVFLPEAALEPFIAGPDDMRERRSLVFEASEATSLTFERDGGGLKLERGDDGWAVVEPEKHDADDEAVRRLLASLASLRAEAFLPFGTELTKPATITVVTESGDESESHVLNVELRPGDRVRARRGDAGAVMEIPGSALSTLTGSPLALWDRRVISFAADRLSRLSITSDGKRESATRAENAWALEGEGEVDVRNADTVKWELSDLTASAYVGRATEAALATYGLDASATRIEIELAAAGAEEKESLELVIGRVEDASAEDKRHYAKLGGDDMVFLLAATSVEKLRRPLLKAGTE